MSVLVDSLSQLTDAQVEAAHALMTQLVGEANPSVDTKRGVIHDLVLHLSAVFSAANSESNNRLQRSMSIKSVTENPDAADDAVVDALFSNYGVTRQAGSRATGQILIVLSAALPVTIASGAQFTADGLVFQTVRAFAAKLTEEEVTSENDRVLLQLNDTEWGFLVDVIAAENGSAYRLKKDTLAIPAQPPRNFVRSYASADFSNGSSTETNAQIASRFQEGIAAPAWSNRSTIWSLVRKQTPFKNVQAISIVGFGDAEMTRDQHSIFPISFGGRCDIYARTRDLPVREPLTVTATLVEKREIGGIWQFTINRTQAPGFYDVPKILRASDTNSSSSYGTTQIIRSFNVGSSGWVPDIVTAAEAVFSPFQTAIVQFLDTDTDVGSLVTHEATQDYTVTIRRMPLLADLQEFMSSRSIRDPAGDVLVKGCVPCDLSINFTIRLRAGDTAPDTASVRSALSARVNALKFPGQLEASLISDTIHNYLDGRAAVGAIDMLGVIQSPVGSPLTLRSNEILAIPDIPARYVTPRTTSFILDPANIGITSITVDAPEI